MRVFISWSGEASHGVAQTLKEWLPSMLNEVEVFLSSEDIEKGSPWFLELGKVLEKVDFGILCLTPENLRAPWVLFEAGAISRQLGSARLVPFLLGVERKDLPDPLKHFNAVAADKAEIKKLLVTLNKHLGAEAIPERTLNLAFNNGWKTLAKALKQVDSETAALDAAEYNFDVFLSAPMAAYTSDAQYVPARLEVKKVFDALTETCGLKVFWAAEKAGCLADFDTYDISVSQDLEALLRSRRFVLLYPEKLATSALFEAGYALAIRLPSHYFVPRREVLPFLMRDLGTSGQDVRIHEQSEWKTYDDLAEKIEKYHDQWFPTASSEKKSARRSRK